jgi:metal-dependent amidase/aminoacylase/carboxypeptidase family protein
MSTTNVGTVHISNFLFYRPLNVSYLVDGYPATINSYPDCVRNVHNAAARVVGEKNSRLPQKTMGAEDFSYFLQKRPGFDSICYFLLVMLPCW